MKRKPTGFIAKCQCGQIVGALDYERTPRSETGKICGQWLADGCTVEPRFAGSWSADIGACKCNEVRKTLPLDVVADYYSREL